MTFTNDSLTNPRASVNREACHPSQNAGKAGSGAGRQWFVYVLKDPRTDEVRYVGWTINPAKRLQGHLSYARKKRENTHKSHWIQGLLKLGLCPVMEVVESGSGPWEDVERGWISRLRSEGVRLTNIATGGEGATGVEVKAETREKLRRAMRDREFTAEWRAKISAAKKGKTSPAIKAQLERLHAMHRGRRQSAEEIEKRASSLRGKKRSPESVEKVAAAHRGKKLSQEHREKLSRSHLGQNLGGTMSVEARQKISQARTGMKFSAAHREHISLAVKSQKRKRLESSGQTRLFA